LLRTLTFDDAPAFPDQQALASVHADGTLQAVLEPGDYLVWNSSVPHEREVVGNVGQFVCGEESVPQATGTCRKNVRF